jgi:hypothetical protein
LFLTFLLICGKTQDLLLSHAPYEMGITGIGIEGSKARCMWVMWVWFKIDLSQEICFPHYN